MLVSVVNRPIVEQWHANSGNFKSKGLLTDDRGVVGDQVDTTVKMAVSACFKGNMIEDYIRKLLHELPSNTQHCSIEELLWPILEQSLVGASMGCLPLFINRVLDL